MAFGTLTEVRAYLEKDEKELLPQEAIQAALADLRVGRLCRTAYNTYLQKAPFADTLTYFTAAYGIAFFYLDGIGVDDTDEAVPTSSVKQIEKRIRMALE